MPRPAALTQVPPHFSHREMLSMSYEDFFKSLSNADKLSFLNALRSGELFNFTPTS